MRLFLALKTSVLRMQRRSHCVCFANSVYLTQTRTAVRSQRRGGQISLQQRRRVGVPCYARPIARYRRTFLALRCSGDLKPQRSNFVAGIRVCVRTSYHTVTNTSLWSDGNGRTGSENKSKGPPTSDSLWVQPPSPPRCPDLANHYTPHAGGIPHPIKARSEANPNTYTNSIIKKSKKEKIFWRRGRV